MIRISGTSADNEEQRDAVYSENLNDYNISDPDNRDPTIYGTIYGSVSVANSSIYTTSQKEQFYRSFPSNYGSFENSEPEDNEGAYGVSEIQSNYGSFHRSDSENNEDIYGHSSAAYNYGNFETSDTEDEEDPYGNAVNPSLSSPIFNQQFLEALQPNSSNPPSTTPDTPQSKSPDQLSESSSKSFSGLPPKSRVKTTIGKRPCNVVIDSDEESDVDDIGTIVARSKSHSLPNTSIFMINQELPSCAIRKISESQVHPSAKEDRKILQARKELEGKPWYNGDIDKEKAGNLIKEKKKDGCFIVRKSDTSGFALTFYVETAKDKGEAKHIKIQLDSNFEQWVLGRTNKTFKSVVDLVEYYIKKGITTDSGQHLELKKPLGSRKQSIIGKLLPGNH